MWSHTFDTTWLRGSGALPVIAARSADGVTGRARPPPAFRLPCAITALLLFRSLDRAQSSRHCNAVAEGKSAIFERERNNPVVNVMSDVGAAAIWNAGTVAPFLDYCGFITTEIGIIFGNFTDS